MLIATSLWLVTLPLSIRMKVSKSRYRKPTTDENSTDEDQNKDVPADTRSKSLSASCVNTLLAPVSIILSSLLMWLHTSSKRMSIFASQIGPDRAERRLVTKQP